MTTPVRQDPGAFCDPPAGSAHNTVLQVVLCFVRIAAALGLALAAVFLPWATFTTSSVTTNLTGRSSALVFIIVAGVIAALSLVQLWHRVPTFGWLILILSVFALFRAIGLALTKISDANNLADKSSLPSHTSYELGAVIGVLLAVVVVVASAVDLYTSSRRRAA